MTAPGRGLRAIAGRRSALAAFAVIACLYGAALLAGFIAPYGADQKHYKAPHDFRYHPPSRLHWRDAEGRFHIMPFVYGSRLDDRARARYVEDPALRYPLRLLVKGARYPLLFGLGSCDRHLFGVDEPARIFPLGADLFGRDVFSRVLYGARVSLSVGLIGIVITMTLGLAVGAAAGYWGGWVDDLLMRGAEVVLSLPALYLVIVLAGFLPVTIPSHLRYLMIVVILSFVGWASLSRVIRGLVLSIRERDFVAAARASGASASRILLRHVIPATASTAIVAATLSVPFYILGEVALSFLGVGVQEPQASWGLMLNDAQSVTALRSHPWLLAPGIFLFAAVMAFNVLGDALRDALDPGHGGGPAPV